MPSDVELAARQIAEALAPSEQPAAARWRWGYVDQVNTDGTMNVNVGTLSDPAVVPSIRCAQHVMGAEEGDRVRVLYLGTEAIVDAVRAYDDQPHVDADKWLDVLGFDIERSDMVYGSLQAGVGSAPVRRSGTHGVLTLASVRLSSAVAANGSAVLGTLPSGYIPAGNVYAQVSVDSNSTAYHNIFIIILYYGEANAGRVTLYNRSGSSLPNNVSLYLTASYIIGDRESEGGGGGGGGGGGEGTTDYEELLNKPSIGGVTLVGNKSFEDLGLIALTNVEINDIVVNGGNSG